MITITGFITLFAGDFAPRGWAFCDGKILTIDNTNRRLFQVIQNYYGGDGINTFALPDLRGRAITGIDPGNNLYNKPGKAGGNEIAQVTPAMFPAHTHELDVTITAHAASTANSSTPENAVYASGSNNLYNFGAPNTFMAPYEARMTTSSTGNASPVTILHPVLTLNYIICINGEEN